VPYSASDLQTASPDVTHVLRMDANEVRKLQVAGFYRDVELSKYEGGTGHGPREGGRDPRYEQIVHRRHLHAAGDARRPGPRGFRGHGPRRRADRHPAALHCDDRRGSGQVLSIRRNFDEGSDLARKRHYFVHYKFMPGLGFYGFGLIHMIGGLGRASTSILRQLIDAGTLANLPAGFKARGVRVRNNDEPLQPGEWRDIDTPGGSIRDSIIPLPYKEPSATLGPVARCDSSRAGVALCRWLMSRPTT
jgi:hypothetical protein